MATKVANKSRYLAIVTLNSGKTYHLAPGESSPPFDELELNGNRKITKLVNSGDLSLTTLEEAPLTHDIDRDADKPVGEGAGESVDEAKVQEAHG